MWMLSLSSSLHAQTWNINGNVTDEQGEPIIGANVIVKGQSTGTITDIDGRFVLDTPKDAVLQITYIGYVSQEVKVSGKKELNVVLKEDITKSQRVEQFILEAADEAGNYQTIYEGTVIGYKKIACLEKIQTDALRLSITKSRVSPTLRFMGIY